MHERHRLISTCGASEILLGPVMPLLEEQVRGRHVILFADEKVFGLHGHLFEGYETILIPQGEQAKSLGRVTLLYQELLRRHVDKSSLVVALGGGVVTDLVGFVAATYLRGVPMGFIPTTLLAQVDAAIGGKNGVNLGEYKNMVGTIRQPEFILIDTDFLNTLPRREFASGLAEVVKYGLIRDPRILDLLEGKDTDEVTLNTLLLNDIIARSVRAKIEVVEEDLDDSGIRKILNFGHTYGHGIERLYDLPHGVAVACGMKLALHISVERGMLDAAVRDRVLLIMEQLGLLPEIKPDNAKVMELITHDKKRRGDTIAFILLREIGKPEIVPMTDEEIEGYVRNFEC